MPSQSVNVPCPGTRDNFIRLTNEVTSRAGVGHPQNSGRCTLYLDALDAAGNVLSSNPLKPGDSMTWFTPPNGTASIVVVCDKTESGAGQLTYDTPIS